MGMVDDKSLCMVLPYKSSDQVDIQSFWEL